jgi:AAA domain/Bifunctional DNA primase/polymerase, N-terminal
VVSDPATVTQLRANLWAAGFRPIPIYNANWPVKSPGKQPLGDRWQIDARANPPLCTSSLAVDHALNTGILSDGLRAIDFDIDDPVLAVECRQLADVMLGATATRVRQGSPRALVLYRAAEGEPGKLTITGRSHTKDHACKIEVLGRGQQFVAFGGHPSGAELRWYPAPPGDEEPRGGLIAVTEEQIQAFLEACAPIIDAPMPGAGNGLNGHARGSGATDAAGLLNPVRALLEQVKAGPAWHDPVLRLVATLVARGTPACVIEAMAPELTWPKYTVADTRAELIKMIEGAHRKGFAPEDASSTSGAGAGDETAEDIVADVMNVGVVDEGAEDLKAEQAIGLWDAGDDDYVIPPRGWLLGTTFCRRFLSSLLADGGVGKTALRVAQLISLAIGRSLTGEYVFQRCRVLIVSLEDDKDELRRRVYAVLRHHNIAPSEVAGWLFLAAPKGLKLVEMREGSYATGALQDILRRTIRGRKLDIVSLDPFIKSHGLSENDNNAIDHVCTILAMMGIEYDMALDFPHHTRKGLGIPGDADRGRGASSQKDAGRLVFTLTPMSLEEAKLFGVPEPERISLVRLDSAKINIAPRSAAALWFRLIGVPLDNASDLYPNGDNVQTVEPWHPPEVWEGLDSALLNRVLDDLEAGLPTGERYSSAGAAKTRAAWPVVCKHAPNKSEHQAREVIRTWVKNGVLFEKDYHDPVQRKTLSGLFVNATLHALSKFHSRMGA